MRKNAAHIIRASIYKRERKMRGATSAKGTWCLYTSREAEKPASKHSLTERLVASRYDPVEAEL